jgi:hypothetical protein
MAVTPCKDLPLLNYCNQYIAISTKHGGFYCQLESRVMSHQGWVIKCEGGILA